MFTEVRSCSGVLLFAKESLEFVVPLVLHKKLQERILEAVTCYPCMRHDCNVATSVEGRKCSYSLSSFSVGNPAVAKHRARSHALHRATLSAVPLSASCQVLLVTVNGNPADYHTIHPPLPLENGPAKAEVYSTPQYKWEPSDGVSGSELPGNYSQFRGFSLFCISSRCRWPLFPFW